MTTYELVGTDVDNGFVLQPNVQSALDAKYSAQGSVTQNVKDNGAVGDGTTDDSTAIQAAVTAAGAGGKVVFPKGVYKWAPTTGISAPSYQTWEGTGEATGQGGTGNTVLYFPNLATTNTAISAGQNFVIKDLFIRGPGAGVASCIGLSNGGSANARISAVRTQFYDFAIGTRLVASYYSSLDHCEWRHNDVGLDLTSVCYNVNILSPRFDGANSSSTYGTCIRADSVESLNVFGGSIESYGGRADGTPHAGLKITNTGTRSNVNLFGTYWETGANGGTGIDITGTTNVNVKVFGAEVQLGNHEGWLYFPTATNGQVFVRGVTFMGSSSLTTTPIAYLSSLGTTATSVDIAGDVWAVTGTAGASYDNGLATLRLAQVMITIPNTYGGPGATAKVATYWGRSLVVPAASWIKTGNAATGSRPSAVTAGAGAMFFDTTLVKPIWSDGTVWRDSAGTAV